MRKAIALTATTLIGLALTGPVSAHPTGRQQAAAPYHGVPQAGVSVTVAGRNGYFSLSYPGAYYAPYYLPPHGQAYYREERYYSNHGRRHNKRHGKSHGRKGKGRHRRRQDQRGYGDR